MVDIWACPKLRLGASPLYFDSAMHRSVPTRFIFVRACTLGNTALWTTTRRSTVYHCQTSAYTCQLFVPAPIRRLATPRATAAGIAAIVPKSWGRGIYGDAAQGLEAFYAAKSNDLGHRSLHLAPDVASVRMIDARGQNDHTRALCSLFISAHRRMHFVKLMQTMTFSVDGNICQAVPVLST